MTYIEFHYIFTIPLFLLLHLVILLKYKKDNQFRNYIFGALTLSIIAFVYTTPWDNFLVYKGIWSYEEERILGKIGFVPYEEYLFFILQTMMTSSFSWLIIGKYEKHMRFFSIQSSHKRVLYKYLGLVFYVSFILFGIVKFDEKNYLYYKLIVFWAFPILIFQWFLGHGFFVKNIKLFLLSVLLPTFYLWIADGIAISLNVWNISSEWTNGINIWGLPFEEALFFLTTNLLVIQGSWLFWIWKFRVERAK